MSIGILRSQRGYMLLSAIFLTLITSFAALFLLNGTIRWRNPQSSLKLVALHLANEQLAVMEARAAAGSVSDTSFPREYEKDLTSANLDKKNSIVFTVTTNISGSGRLRVAKVTVTWRVDEQDFTLEAERTIYFAKAKTE